MLYEFPFDPAIFRQQCELRYKLLYNKRLKRSKTNLIMSVMIVLIGLSFVREGLALGYFFLSMGLYFVAGALYFFWRYKKTMRQLRKEDKEMNGRPVKDIISSSETCSCRWAPTSNTPIFSARAN